MKLRHLLPLIAMFATLTGSAQVKFDDYFLPKTMRFDYYHAGSATTEYYLADEVIEEPYWAGNKNYLIDERNMGNHLFKVIDKATGTLIYSRGFSSLFNEWQTTPEAKTSSKARPEGVVNPYPENDGAGDIYTREKRRGK